MHGDATTADAPDELFCPECGYSLRGIDSERCPECGNALDRARLLRTSSIPWAHRRQIGRWKAYWRTVAMTLRNPRRVADNVAVPVRLDDALAFRRLTALIATVPIALLIVWYFALSASLTPLILLLKSPDTLRGEPRGVVLGWILELGLLPVAWAAVYLFVLAAAGVASFFFHPPTLPVVRQNRAVALSYYGCAPLALTPLSVASIGLFAVLFDSRFRSSFAGVVLALLFLAALVIPIVQLFSSFTLPLRLMRRATHCSAARVWVMGAVLPLAWTLLAAVIAIGIPVAYLFVAIVILSLV